MVLSSQEHRTTPCTFAKACRVKGDAPGNARGSRFIRFSPPKAGEKLKMNVRLRKVPQKIKPPVMLRPRRQANGKPAARLFRSSSFGKGEKVG